jgi:hypothetical protein
VRKSDDLDEHGAIDAVELLEIEVALVLLQRFFEVVLHERQDGRLAHRHDVVAVEDFRGIVRPELFVGLERGERDRERALVDFRESCRKRLLEHQEDRDRQEVTERLSQLTGNRAELVRQEACDARLATIELPVSRVEPTL